MAAKGKDAKGRGKTAEPKHGAVSYTELGQAHSRAMAIPWSMPMRHATEVVITLSDHKADVKCICPVLQDGDDPVELDEIAFNIRPMGGPLQVVEASSGQVGGNVVALSGVKIAFPKQP
eukprot:4595605-Amphidinium_carterae.1